jgi:hypothetical protein
MGAIFRFATNGTCSAATSTEKQNVPQSQFRVRIAPEFTGASMIQGRVRRIGDLGAPGSICGIPGESHARHGEERRGFVTETIVDHEHAVASLPSTCIERAPLISS